MKSPKRSEFLLILMLPVFMTACSKAPVPKPRGYFRIDFPEKKYARFDGQNGVQDMPCSFDYPVYGIISPSGERNGNEGWFNIDFPAYRARIYLTYRYIHNDFASLMEQTYRLNVKNHIAKADAINEQAITNNDRQVYGMLYDLAGNTATSVQFYATDSTRHYLRGSLYFSAEPNSDSLAPVIKFFREDIVHLMETLDWK
ncbi:MAG TPA: gliding motility lipoprotein GldD [Bacteroidales bacterium]|jgi:gliding motility-associated lipoprotein GldD|nr:gliding motility lipoprotein GldD [Bacteroidales bacterium]